MEILVPSALFLRPDIHPCPEEMERISFEWNLQVYSSAAVRKKNKKKYNNKNEKKNNKKNSQSSFRTFSLFKVYILSNSMACLLFFSHRCVSLQQYCLEEVRIDCVGPPQEFL